MPRPNSIVPGQHGQLPVRYPDKPLPLERAGSVALLPTALSSANGKTGIFMPLNALASQRGIKVRLFAHLPVLSVWV